MTGNRRPGGGNNGNGWNGRRHKRGPRRFNHKMQAKLVVLFIAVLLAFAVLILRLFMINRNNGNEYKKQVLSQRSYDSRNGACDQRADL